MAKIKILNRLLKVAAVEKAELMLIDAIASVYNKDVNLDECKVWLEKNSNKISDSYFSDFMLEAGFYERFSEESLYKATDFFYFINQVDDSTIEILSSTNNIDKKLDKKNWILEKSVAMQPTENIPVLFFQRFKLV